MTDRWWWRGGGWAGAGFPADPSPAGTRSCAAKKAQAQRQSFFPKIKLHSRQKFTFSRFWHHNLLFLTLFFPLDY
jgi:hypothetical protein